ncbi:hypothetical protein [Zavarzinia sp. CC-PAN008]|uniref:hypothetical protein n=1 Tax=Zavarzinia sp. CC-PAN008 TaxID=3243332 RepID=UPI003F7483FC
MRRAEAGLFLGAFLFLAACAQEMPPGSFMPPPPGLVDGSAVPVLVAPVEGMPAEQARPLAEAVAKGLRARDWPAGTLNPAPGSRLLQVRRVGVVLEARLLDASGVVLGRAFVPDREVAPAAEQGERVAGAIVGAVERRTARSQSPAAARRTVAVGGVIANMPGGDALAAALDLALRRAGFAVTSPDDPDSAVVAGEVFVSPAGNASRAIEVTWTVMDASGATLGRLDQANAVAADALESGLGPMAPDIVDAILPGLAQVLQAQASPDPGSFTGP